MKTSYRFTPKQRQIPRKGKNKDDLDLESGGGEVNPAAYGEVNNSQ